MSDPTDPLVRTPALQNNGPRVQSRDGAAAYGGPGWSGRASTLAEELGGVWSACGIDSEWNTLKAVMLHRPGDELGASRDPDAVQMLAPLDIGRAQAEFDAMMVVLTDSGVEIHQVAPDDAPLPNQMFCADLFVMNRAINFVTLGPRRILMADGYPRVQSAFESCGVECSSTPVDELSKAAGGFGCLTGVLRRAPWPA